MAVKIQKLDKRFDGHAYFKYRATLLGPLDERMVTFAEFRSWMIDTYGKSNELDLHIDLTVKGISGIVNDKWAWKYDTSYGMYIYIKDDEILPWITLRWVG